jgi:hypothetical protein
MATDREVKFALVCLRNSGIDTDCGACMEAAFTGITTNEHVCLTVTDARCEWPGCGHRAEWEAWFGRGVVVKLLVCVEHIKESIGWKSKHPESSSDVRMRRAGGE